MKIESTTEKGTGMKNIMRMQLMEDGRFNLMATGSDPLSNAWAVIELDLNVIKSQAKQAQYNASGRKKSGPVVCRLLGKPERYTIRWNVPENTRFQIIDIPDGPIEIVIVAYCEHSALRMAQKAIRRKYPATKKITGGAVDYFVDALAFADLKVV